MYRYTHGGGGFGSYIPRTRMLETPLPLYCRYSLPNIRNTIGRLASSCGARRPDPDRAAAVRALYLENSRTGICGR